MKIKGILNVTKNTVCGAFKEQVSKKGIHHDLWESIGHA